MSEKAIVRYEPTREEWETIKAIAPTAQASRMFGITEDQAAITMVTAHELGFPWVMALNGLLYPIDTPNGKKVALSSAAVNALIQRSGVLAELEIIDHTDKDGTPVGCTVRMKRADNGTEYAGSFMLADAQRVTQADKDNGRKTGLLEKYNWKAYPAEMYFARALTKTGRRVCPDVLANMYLFDELGAVTDEKGELVTDSAWEVVESPPQTPPEKGGNGKGDPVAASKASEPVEAKNEEAPAAAEPEKKVSVKPPAKQEAPPLEVNTVADILAAGHDVSAIQTAVNSLKEAGQDVHFPPATNTECQQVMQKLQEA